MSRWSKSRQIIIAKPQDYNCYVGKDTTDAVVQEQDDLDTGLLKYRCLPTQRLKGSNCSQQWPGPGSAILDGDEISSRRQRE